MAKTIVSKNPTRLENLRAQNRAAKAGCGPVNTISNNTSEQTMGDLARAAARGEPVPYVDHNRDARDYAILGATKAAMQLLELHDMEMVGGVLMLIRDRLEADAGGKFEAEVAHHAAA